MNRSLTSADSISGWLMIIVGVATSAYAAASYGIGTMHLVGPGAFPLGIGVLLAAIGAAVLLVSVKRTNASDHNPHRIEWAGIARVGFSISAFALLVGSFGAIPAVAAVSFISIADRSRKSWVRAGAATVLLSVGSILLFQQFLGLRFVAIRWPF